VRQGASWTAATTCSYGRGGGQTHPWQRVGALGVLAAERSWWLLAQTASARRSVQPVSSGRASSPWSTLPAAKPRRRSPVSSMRCPPIRSRRPGSGCPAVRCPVTWDRRPEGPALGRPLSTRPASSRPLSTRPVSSRPASAVCCLPPSVRTRPDPPTQAVALGTGSSWPGDRDHRNGWRPGGCRAVDGSTTVQEAGTRAMLAKSRWSLGGRWRTRAAGVGCGRRRPRLPAERPGRPGRGAGRSSRAAARWARVQAAARGGCSARWLQPPRGCRPPAGSATTVRGRRRA
jgi:hypothetical protein